VEWTQRDHLDDAAEIAVPALMFANGEDAFFDPDDLSATADRMADCTFVLNQGLPHISLDPDTLMSNTQRTIEFLDEHRLA